MASSMTVQVGWTFSRHQQIDSNRRWCSRRDSRNDLGPWCVLGVIGSGLFVRVLSGAGEAWIIASNAAPGFDHCKLWLTRVTLIKRRTRLSPINFLKLLVLPQVELDAIEFLVESMHALGERHSN